jgi:adenylate cyclase
MRHSYYRQIPLAPLDQEAVGEMISSIVGSDPSLAGFASHVIDRTGGNPFFVEEVVRMLIEEGTLEGVPGSYRLVGPVDRVRVPPTVQALLASRVDRLQPADKQVLQTASVLGITFSDEVLASVVNSSEESLAESLQTLCGAEFLINEARHPVPEYRFWHPLTQEVAYGSMLGDRRAQIHAGVAQALIDLDPARLNERAALIANHFEAAGWALDAARWSARAADWALRTDLNESLRRWRKAIELVDDTAPSDGGVEIGLQARHRLARWGARAGMPQDEVDLIVEAATTIAESAGNTRALALLAFTHGAVSLYRGNVEQARASVDESVRIADTTSDLGLKTAARIAPPVVIGVTGPIEDGLAMLEEGLIWAEEDPDRGAEHLGYNLLARNLCTRSYLLARAGRLRDALVDADRAVEMARERSEAEILGWTLAVYPLVDYLTGDGRDPLSLAEEAVRVAEDTGNINLQPLAHAALGTAHLNRGEWSEAVRACTTALDLAHRHGLWLFEEGSMNLFLSESHLGAGDHEGALRVADEAVVTSKSRGTQIFECGALITRNRIRRLTLDRQPQESWDADLDQADRLVDETGAEAWRPFLLVERAELARLRGDGARADDLQRDAIRAFSANGAAGHASRLRTAWQTTDSLTPPER